MNNDLVKNMKNDEVLSTTIESSTSFKVKKISAGEILRIQNTSMFQNSNQYHSKKHSLSSTLNQFLMKNIINKIICNILLSDFSKLDLMYKVKEQFCNY